MSFEAKVAKNGNYHEADVEVGSDSRNWPRPKKQEETQVDETTEVETTAEVAEINDDAENKQ